MFLSMMGGWRGIWAFVGVDGVYVEMPVRRVCGFAASLNSCCECVNVSIK